MLICKLMSECVDYTSVHGVPENQVFSETLMDTHAFHAVIPAAGSGSRFRSSMPKQMFRVGKNNNMVLYHTVRVFSLINIFENVIVVVPDNENQRKEIEVELKEFDNITLVAGSTSRHRSILNGLKCLQNKISSDDSDKQDIVVIHDAVRPLVNNVEIWNVIDQTKIHKAAGVFVPMVSTVLQLDDDSMLEKGLDRSKLCASEMPQGFDFNMIIQAYHKCSDHELDTGTECLDVMKKYANISAKLIRGDPDRLWKITYYKDMLLLREFLRLFNL